MFEALGSRLWRRQPERISPRVLAQQWQSRQNCAIATTQSPERDTREFPQNPQPESFDPGCAGRAIKLTFIRQRHGRGAGVGRGLAVGAGLAVGVGLAVAVGVAVAVAVGVAVAVAVAVAVGLAVDVGVGDGLAQGGMS